jgi:hypothetical protein
MTSDTERTVYVVICRGDADPSNELKYGAYEHGVPDEGCGAPATRARSRRADRP